MIIDTFGPQKPFLRLLRERRYPPFLLILALFGAFWGGQDGWASTALCLKNDEAGIRIVCPVGFKSVPLEENEALILLRAEGSALPSFNVVEQPTRASLATSPEEAAKEVLESYRAVGLTDASLIRSGTKPVGGGAWNFVDIRYKSGLESLASRVILVPRSSSSLIMTWISEESTFESSLIVLDDLLAGVTLSSLGGAQAGGVRGMKFLDWTVLLAVLIVGVAVLRVWRRRHAAH